ncbi:YdeI/OmpD-associated family protein [Zhouia spongiae]|uniref:YdeI/OmpD-associated family protein n=1 Tax=Zhouia spongiae TaxID=2202721 RepID=A0ABY3YKD5_9FLAO|nr:YdeI/OmpD-associated family protein [Zhouia spongiae]UNY97623.1 YdeI/OmpD-associated family protein [Zhouia spongiae]
MNKPIHYFKNRSAWRAWLLENHSISEGVYLIFYTVGSDFESMRWEEAVQEALCFGWIDSTVKKIGTEKRKQYFCPRKEKSVWSKLNKTYIEQLIKADLMHEAGLSKIKIAKQNGSWKALDDVENLVVPPDLQSEFDKNVIAFNNYSSFSKTYKKSYLYWLNQAKREITRQKRIQEIIILCEQNIKSRNNR